MGRAKLCLIILFQDFCCGWKAEGCPAHGQIWSGRSAPNYAGGELPPPDLPRGMDTWSSIRIPPTPGPFTGLKLTLSKQLTTEHSENM